MTHLERFKAICRGQETDYVPIIGLPGASGVAFGGAWGQVYQRLLDTGMPDYIKGWTTETGWDIEAAKSWSDYWGTLTPLTIQSWPCEPAKGLKYNRKVNGQYEILEYETGAVTKQLLDNENMYSMPEFIKYHVRDWDSWQLYKKLNTPGELWPVEKFEQFCKQFDNRDRPLFLQLESTWGKARDLAGPEQACVMLYDNPDLMADIINWQSQIRKKYLHPLVERLRPEILQLSEDICYKHGMLISPDHFKQFCSPVYRETTDLAKACEAEVVVVDTDGKIDQLMPLLVECGVNGIYPVESKADNDLFQLRKQYTDFIFFGWLEKEVVNEGNEDQIEKEINEKVPAMLKGGRYFPNIDHSLQPFCTFDNLCKFMEILHNVTNNPEGQFQRFTNKEK
jgi:uroporphyrinogen decarboxylase